jgi:hypothetical protein
LGYKKREKERIGGENETTKNDRGEKKKGNIKNRKGKKRKKGEKQRE